MPAYQKFFWHDKGMSGVKSSCMVALNKQVSPLGWEESSLCVSFSSQGTKKDKKTISL